MLVSDEQQHEQTRPSTPVTSMSLRAERMRMRFAQAAGAKVHDPGLSPAPAVRDPALVNRFAVAALAVGIVALFLSTFYIASTATFVLCVLSVLQWRSLQRQGKQPWGRRRTIWAFWFGVFGVAQCSFGLFIVPLFH
jgi:hypothetical protein